MSSELEQAVVALLDVIRFGLVGFLALIFLAIVAKVFG